MDIKFFFDDLNVLVIDDQLGNPGNEMSPYFAAELEKSLRRRNRYFENVLVKILYVSKPEDIDEIIDNSAIDIILLDLQFKIEENDRNVLFFVKGRDSVGEVILEYLGKYQKNEKNLFVRHTPVIIYSARDPFSGTNVQSIEDYRKKLGREYIDYVAKNDDGNIKILVEKIENSLKRFYTDLYTENTNNREFEDCMRDNQLRLIYTRTVRSRLIGNSKIFLYIFYPPQPGDVSRYNRTLIFSDDSLIFYFTRSALDRELVPSISMVFPQDRNYMNYRDLKKFLEDRRKKIGGRSLNFISSEEIKGKSNYFYVSESEGYIKSPKKEHKHSERFNFLGEERFLDNRFLLAATPLTGYSFENEPNWMESYLNKLLGLICETEIGGIILKTVYRDREPGGDKKFINNIVHIHSARGYHKDGMIYNTGKTAQENVTPLELSQFLEYVKAHKDYNRINGKIILSFGSHNDNISIWGKIFDDVFGEKPESDTKNGGKNSDFQLIEINARHAIRGINKRSKKRYETTAGEKALLPMLLGVDEYFVSPDTGNYMGFWYEFENWLREIQKIAVGYRKKLMIKLPFRSDLNILAYIINKIVKQETGDYGIWGITVINTVKSPFGGNITLGKDLADKLNLGYGMGRGDFINLPQLSGSSLKFLRNLAIYTVKTIIKDNPKLELSASGGIMDKADVDEVLALGANTVQLSTLSLVDINETKKVQRNIKRIKFWPEKCQGCETCLKIESCNAIAKSSRRILFYEEKCQKCGKCIIKCRYNAFTEITEEKYSDSVHEYNSDENLGLDEKYFNTRNIKEFLVRKAKFVQESCIRCGRCVRIGYCDAIFNKFASETVISGNLIIPGMFPIINEEKCTGCGMCISVCEHNALRLNDELTEENVKCPVCGTQKQRPIYFWAGSDLMFLFCKDCNSILKKKPGVKSKSSPALIFDKIVAITLKNENDSDTNMIVTVSDSVMGILLNGGDPKPAVSSIVKLKKKNHIWQILIQCRGIRNLLIKGLNFKSIKSPNSIGEIDQSQWEDKLKKKLTPEALNKYGGLAVLSDTILKEKWRLLSVYNNDYYKKNAENYGKPIKVIVEI